MHLCEIIQSNPRQSKATLQSNSGQFHATLGNSEQFEVTPRNETNPEFSRKTISKSFFKTFFSFFFSPKFRIRFVARGYLKLLRVTQSCVELPGVTL